MWKTLAPNVLVLDTESNLDEKGTSGPEEVFGKTKWKDNQRSSGDNPCRSPVLGSGGGRSQTDGHAVKAL